MTSKEALEYLTSKVFTGGNSILETEAEICANVIKQDLERLEVLEKENVELRQEVSALEDYSYDVDCEKELLIKENEKLKKALFITYMKTVDLELLKDCFELKDYNDRVNFFKELTQQEYELLKEVLGE